MTVTRREFMRDAVAAATAAADQHEASFALVDGFCRAREITFSSREGANAAHRPRLVLSGSPSTVVVAATASLTPVAPLAPV